MVLCRVRALDIDSAMDATCSMFLASVAARSRASVMASVSVGGLM